jgi:hypothetical protein
MLQSHSVATGSSFRDYPGCAILLPMEGLRGRAIAVSTMISEVYDALISAGAAEDKARKAAETLADTDNRFSRIDGAVLKLESKLDGAVLKLESKLDSAVLKLEAELVLVKWMVGFSIAMNVAILTRSFFH